MRAGDKPRAKSFRGIVGPAMGIEIKCPPLEEPDLVNGHRSAFRIADSNCLAWPAPSNSNTNHKERNYAIDPAHHSDSPGNRRFTDVAI